MDNYLVGKNCAYKGNLYKVVALGYIKERGEYGNEYYTPKTVILLKPGPNDFREFMEKRCRVLKTCLPTHLQYDTFIKQIKQYMTLYNWKTCCKEDENVTQ